MCEEIQICVLESLIVNNLNSDVKAWVLLSYFDLFCVLCITAESCVAFGEVGASSQRHGTKKCLLSFSGKSVNLGTCPVQTSLVMKWEFLVDWLHLSKNSTLGVSEKSGWGWKKRLGEKCLIDPEQWSIKPQIYRSVKNRIWGKKMVLKWCQMALRPCMLKRGGKINFSLWMGMGESWA